jgi:hypothetical protein
VVERFVANEQVASSILVSRSKIMKRPVQRIVKLVATVEVERFDWGFQVTHPVLGLLTSGKTESEAFEKMDKEITRKLEFDLVHGKSVKAKAGR